MQEWIVTKGVFNMYSFPSLYSCNPKLCVLSDELLLTKSYWAIIYRVVLVTFTFIK